MFLKFDNSLLLLPIISLVLISCTIEVHSGPGDDKKVLHEKTFKTSPGKNFELKSSTGEVLVTEWDRDEVYVKISGDEDAEERMKFYFDESEDKIKVTAEKEGSLFGLFTNGIELIYEIKVPSEFNLNLHTAGGDIRLGNVSGYHDLQTSGGDFWIKNTNGVLKIHTSGGDVNLDNTAGTLDVSTSGGDIMAIGFEGKLNAETSGGDIKLKGSNSEIYAHTSGGDINVDYAGTNKGIDLSTSGGDITILLPADFDASADLSTSGGDVSCELTMNNTGKISSYKILADLNNGGLPLVAHTSGGNVVVRKK